ncbi:MAG: DNA methyltransferase [Fusobacterium sp.]
MTIDKIENKIKKLINNGIDKNTFIYDFLLAFGTPKATIKRLREGNSNLSKEEGQLTWKKWLTFKELENEDLYLEVTKLKEKSKYNERFIVVTDYKYLLAIDTKTDDKLDIEISDIARYFDFFLPLAGMEKAHYQSENPADVRAAERMARLFDEIRRDNLNDSNEFKHSLNIFFARLLFCYFAEDTGIFTKGQFTDNISSLTNQDGSDLGDFLERLFQILDTDNSVRGELPNYLNYFPYVNGGLFTEKIELPKFTAHSRRVMIDAGDLDWAAINPDIFGSMFQGVISTEKRNSLGMHYTSVPNIMKVINPLFLDELREEMKEVSQEKTTKKLYDLLKRIRDIKIFDPACGSGNFLIIAYKELRRLEMDIYNRIKKYQMLIGVSTGIKLNNFYGIEIDDFACEIGKLALWIAEHQMHIETEKKFGFKQPTLPLQEAGKIVCGNATRLDWNQICPISKEDEVYVLGNPPYKGSRKQDSSQKEDLKYVFNKMKKYKDLDYISIWFYIGSFYIKGKNAKLSFVSTNSICQGEQVSLLWPYIFENKVEINFAYTSFKWKNSAQRNAGVTVIIVGLANIGTSKANLYIKDIKKSVEMINSYLLPANKDLFIYSRSKPLSKIPEMNHGNMPADGGKFLYTPEEKDEIIKKEPNSKKWFKKILSVREHLNGRERWCLWLEGISKNELESLPVIKEIVDEVYKIRINSSRPKLAEIPNLFAQITQSKKGYSVIVPRVSSENRDYLPNDFIDNETYKVTDSYFNVTTDEIYIFSFLSSKMHTNWMKSIGGKLETRIQYSKNIVYNTFTIPKLTKKQKEELENCALKILDIREKYPEKTLAQLYDPNKMPEDLREAHRENDLAVERCYRAKPFESDEERLEYLFKLYERMRAKED